MQWPYIHGSHFNHNFINFERSRNKERLEASLAGLCELELLKQRQESRVLSALCLGDSPAISRPPWGVLRSVQCPSYALKESLEQQVAELKMNTEVKSAHSPADLEDSHLNSGKMLILQITENVTQSGSPESSKYHSVLPRSLSAPIGTGETETGGTWFSDPTRGTTDASGEMRGVDSNQEDYQQAQKVETYIFGLIQRRALPTHHSKPRTSLAHDVQPVGMVRQSNLCCKEEHYSPKQESVSVISTPSHCTEETASQAYHKLDQDHYLEMEFTEEAPPPYHPLQQSVQGQAGFHLKPRQASMINISRSTLLDYPSCRVLQAHPDSSNDELDSPKHFYSYLTTPALLKPHQIPSSDEQLVSAEYIPAQPCRASNRACAHHHSNPHGSGVPKANQSTFSPERAPQVQPSKYRGGPKKCRSNEDRNGSNRKLGKKTCRSQSENSLPRVPERKYNTMERDGGGSGSGGRGSRSSQSKGKKQQQGSGNYRRWQSTLELSQDEADQPPRDQCSRRTRKSRSTHTSYVSSHRNHHSHYHQHMEYQLEREQVPLYQPRNDYSHPRQGESESSVSEADSADSSSLSSDSDESGGLVWPQQLPPQLSLPSPHAPPGAPLQPKAFVKIKASHALKKKILRFRTGSLKVMTTV
uniref:Uncharacterized protein n=1 Tax=Anabas testudineus TaxID=64144 RepID=A0A3Q1IXF4_ANATE